MERDRGERGEGSGFAGWVAELLLTQSVSEFESRKFERGILAAERKMPRQNLRTLFSGGLPSSLLRTRHHLVRLFDQSLGPLRW